MLILFIVIDIRGNNITSLDPLRYDYTHLQCKSLEKFYISLKNSSWKESQNNISPIFSCLYPVISKLKELCIIAEVPLDVTMKNANSKYDKTRYDYLRLTKVCIYIKSLNLYRSNWTRSFWTISLQKLWCLLNVKILVRKILFYQHHQEIYATMSASQRLMLKYLLNCYDLCISYHKTFLLRTLLRILSI